MATKKKNSAGSGQQSAEQATEVAETTEGEGTKAPDGNGMPALLTEREQRERALRDEVDALAGAKEDLERKLIEVEEALASEKARILPQPKVQRDEKSGLLSVAVEPGSLYACSGAFIEGAVEEINELQESAKEDTSAGGMALGEIRLEVRHSLPSPTLMHRGQRVPEYFFHREHRTDRWLCYVRRYLVGDIGPEQAEQGVYPMARALEDLADIQSGPGGGAVKVVLVPLEDFVAGEKQWAEQLAAQEEAERVRTERVREIEAEQARLEQEAKDVKSDLAAPAPGAEGKPTLQKGFNVSRAKPKGLAEIEALMAKTGGR